MRRYLDQAVQRIDKYLPSGPRLVVIGSASFWHEESEDTCIEIGYRLAEVADLVLITGGVGGAGETTGRAFFASRRESAVEPRIYHVLPQRYPSWDYGETLFAGRDMEERREILGRLSRLYLAIEGGPGTRHEARVASAQNAVLIPVGRSGGHAAKLYRRMKRPANADEESWAVLGSRESTPKQVGAAVLRVVKSYLMAGAYPAC